MNLLSLHFSFNLTDQVVQFNIYKSRWKVTPGWEMTCERRAQAAWVRDNSAEISLRRASLCAALSDNSTFIIIT